MLDPHKKPWPYQKVNTAHPLAKGLVGCWMMNEGGGSVIHDSSGNGNDGVVTTASVLPSWWRGELYFKGDSEKGYIALPDLSGYFNTEGTIIIELKNDAHTYPVWEPAETGMGCLGINTGSNDHYAYTDGNIYLSCLRNDRLNLGNVGISDRTQWHTFTITNKPGANNWKFYQNGIEYYNNTGEDTVTFPTTPCFGIGYIGSSYYYKGNLRYIYIYNIALSQSKIQAIHANPYQMFEPVFSEVLFGYVAPVAGGLSIPIAYHHYRQLHGN